MVQVLGRNQLAPTMGESLGTGLSGGLGNLLQGLAEGKMKQLQKQQLQQAGLPAVLAEFDPQVQAAYLKQFGAAQQLAQQQQLGGLADQYLQNAEFGTPLPGQSPQQGFRQFNQPQSPLGQLQPGQEDILQAQDTQTIEPDGAVQNKIKEKEVIYKPTRAQTLSNTIDGIEKQLMDPNIDPRVKPYLRTQLEKKQADLAKISDRAFDKTEKLRNEVTQEAIDAKELRDMLDRQLELVKGGGMTPAGTIKFFEGMGLDVDALKSNDTQEFIKNNAPFLKNLQKMFGGKVSEGQTKLYMRMIANEYQSPEAMRRVLEGFKKGANAAVLRDEAMNKVIQANAGIPTETLKQDIENIVEDDIKKLSKDFKRILKEEQIADVESGLEIAVKQAAGKTLGSAGPIAGSALLGAGVGSVVPGLGTGLGAGIGAGIGAGTLGLQQVLRLLGGQ